ncbi:hypothetical protein [Streptomyces minutiscleroticus]|uniref:Uncharacterized protein n=1 Tax=Streptomyces minutiscleroticus TaxID=68238 RepID=A0A918NUJ2_9ACTN|nr:hypothetical protein [Streptomyces minutiscleroticus]GGX97682.1 hypothetical protein GCM10010358_59250 [Streptomyces minutiscleroticus]
MLALRLARSAGLAVQLRRLLVAAAAAGTGFLLLSALGHALGHPDAPGSSVLRLAWCLVPLAATVYLAVAVARTDPGTRPRPGLTALGFGPGRLMAVSAVTTALSCVLGSAAALLSFLYLRGDLGGSLLGGGAPDFLAVGRPLPLPAALTLLALLPAAASVTTALVLRPRDVRDEEAGPAGQGRFLKVQGAAGVYRRGAYSGTGAFGSRAATRGVFGAYGRFGAHRAAMAHAASGGPAGIGAGSSLAAPDGAQAPGGTAAPRTAVPGAAVVYDRGTASAGAGAPDAAVPARPGAGAHALAGASAFLDGGDAAARTAASGDGTAPAAPAPQAAPTADPVTAGAESAHAAADSRRPAPGGLPWGVAVLAAGLAVEAYASSTGGDGGGIALPGGNAGAPAGVLAGWLLTAMGLALATPGLTHFCGRLLQAVGPGALRLLAGRVLMEEAERIGRPLGVLCAVASALYALATLHTGARPGAGPLTVLGALVVTGCALTTLLSAALEVRQSRAETTAALLRLGSPVSMLRAAAVLRAGALIALFTPLILVVAELAALPMAR